jgi:aspartyl-tRNA(Asn)/glutamyl-tRNA(Gln) amidotransferase subunit B
VTYGDLYHGNMRFDVNVSIAPKGATELGTRAEVKNLNSFRSVERATEYEFNRQAELLERGEKVVQETRGWNEDTGTTSSQRSKENAQDYRYMPDADIPPIVLSDEQIAEMQADLPKLPHEYREEWRDLGVDSSVINSILGVHDYAKIVSAVLDRAGIAAAKRVANWISSNLSTDETATTPLASIEDLVTLAAMADAAEITSNAGADLFNQLMKGAVNPRQLAQDQGLLQNSNEDEIIAIVDAVLADPASAQAVSDIKAGNDKAIGFLVGQVMKLSKGQANPGMAQKLIRERLQ